MSWRRWNLPSGIYRVEFSFRQGSVGKGVPNYSRAFWSLEGCESRQGWRTTTRGELIRELMNMGHSTSAEFLLTWNEIELFGSLEFSVAWDVMFEFVTWKVGEVISGIYAKAQRGLVLFADHCSSSGRGAKERNICSLQCSSSWCSGCFTSYHATWWFQAFVGRGFIHYTHSFSLLELLWYLVFAWIMHTLSLIHVRIVVVSFALGQCPTGFLKNALKQWCSYCWEWSWRNCLLLENHAIIN